jgi:hypothetical protein
MCINKIKGVILREILNLGIENHILSAILKHLFYTDKKTF